MKRAMPKLIATFLVSMCLLPAVAHAQRLHLVTVALPPLAPHAGQPGFADAVAREAFRRVGVDIEVSVLPGDRALMNVNTGLDDGDLLRTPAVEKGLPEPGAGTGKNDGFRLRRLFAESGAARRRTGRPETLRGELYGGLENL
jgi:hypothetical protein